MTMSQRDAAHDLDVMVDLTRQMGETFELAPLLRTIEQAARSALDSERATVFLYNPEADELYSKVATGTQTIKFQADRGIAGKAARTKSIIVVPDAYADSRFNPEIDKKTGYQTRNLLTLPLVTPDGQMIGVLQLLNKTTGDFTPQDERLATALGALTALAIKRQMLLDEAATKRRLEHDLNVARDIQRRLLPKENPRLDGFDITGWNQPADQTGGDCYDFRQLDNGRLSFMIADAMGHGIGPALIVAQCRAILRAVTDSEDELGTIATRVNNLLCEDLAAGRFVTICFGVLDAPAARIDYLSAGQGPVLVFREATGTAEAFMPSSMPMGVMPDMLMDLADPIRLAPGDIFLLLTDGFLEWQRPDGQQYGRDRLVEVLRRHRSQPTAQLIQTIYQDVLRFSGSTPQADDLTAIAIKRRMETS